MTTEAPGAMGRGPGRSRRPVFPFTAIVGQDRMRRALVLNAINPRIGGVLVRGEKGTAKSTTVRALANLLPEIAVVSACRYGCDPASPDTWCDECRAAERMGAVDGHGTTRGRRGGARHGADGVAGSAPGVARRRVPLVELPVGATEDRVVGTLDLERAIKQGERHFDPGLLAAANRGILYVDEVNLLNDHLVDVLLDAAAMGVNYVEREGVSVQHPSEFLLVGTMNPEEGELRPQLLDRFALAVEVEGLHDPAQRAEVVRRRIAFEADPGAFAVTWAAAESEERERILAARAMLPRVRLDERMLGLITQLCCDFEVDGLRADIVTYKTAQTLAAYAGADRVTATHVRDAAELALLHRRRRQPLEQPALDPERLEERIRQYLEREAPESADDEGPAEDENPAPTSFSGSGDGEAQHSTPERVFTPTALPRPPALAAPTPRAPRASGRGRRSKSIVYPWQAQGGETGPYVRSVVPRERTPRDWAFDATLRAAAPLQPARRRATAAAATSVPMAVRLERHDLRQKVREVRLNNLILFVVDASGSMAARDRMAAAKGAVLSLLLDAYRKRDQVGLIAFRGRGADLLLPPTRSVDLAEARLRELPTGGRTPLAHGLALAAETLERHVRTHAETLPLIVLISDGRANVPLTAGGRSAPRGTAAPPDAWSEWGRRTQPHALMAEVRTLGAQLQQQGVASVVIDSEAGPLQLGMAREVASALGARYLALAELDAERLAGAVRQARA